MAEGICHSSEEMVTDSEYDQVSARPCGKKMFSNDCESTQSSDIIPCITRSFEKEGQQTKYENLKNLRGAQNTVPSCDGHPVFSAAADIEDTPPEKRMRFNDPAIDETKRGANDFPKEKTENKLSSVPSSDLCLHHEQQEASMSLADVTKGCGKVTSDSKELEELGRRDTEQKFAGEMASRHKKGDSAFQSDCTNYKPRRSVVRGRSPGGEMSPTCENFYRRDANNRSQRPSEARNSDEGGLKVNGLVETIFSNYDVNEKWEAKPQEESEDLLGDKSVQHRANQEVLVTEDVIEKYIPPRILKALNKFMETQRTCELLGSETRVPNSDDTENDDSSPSLINQDFLKDYMASELKDGRKGVVTEVTGSENHRGFAAGMPYCVDDQRDEDKKNAAVLDSNEKMSIESKERNPDSVLGIQLSANVKGGIERIPPTNTEEVLESEESRETGLVPLSFETQPSLFGRRGTANELISKADTNTGDVNTDDLNTKEVNVQSDFVGKADSKTNGVFWGVDTNATNRGTEGTFKTTIHCSFSPSEVSPADGFENIREKVLKRINVCEKFPSDSYQNDAVVAREVIEAGDESEEMFPGENLERKESNSAAYNDSTLFQNSNTKNQVHGESQTTGKISYTALSEEQRVMDAETADNCVVCVNDGEEEISQTRAALNKLRCTDVELNTPCLSDTREMRRPISDCYAPESYHGMEIPGHRRDSIKSFISTNFIDMNKIEECYKWLESSESLSASEVAFSSVTQCTSVQCTFDIKVEGNSEERRFGETEHNDLIFSGAACSGSEKRSGAVDNFTTRANKIQEFVANSLEPDHPKNGAIQENVRHRNNSTAVSETPTNGILPGQNYAGNSVRNESTEDFEPVTSSTSIAIKKSIYVGEKRINVEGVPSQNTIETATLVFNVNARDCSLLPRITAQELENIDPKLYSGNSSYCDRIDEKTPGMRMSGEGKVGRESRTGNSGMKSSITGQFRDSLQVEQRVYENDVESESLITARKGSTEKSESLLRNVSHPEKSEDNRIAVSYGTNNVTNKYEANCSVKDENNFSEEESSDSVTIISDEDSSLSLDSRTLPKKERTRELDTFGTWNDVIVPSARIKNTNKQSEGEKQPRRSNRIKQRSIRSRSSDDSDFDYEFARSFRASKEKRGSARDALRKDGYDENSNSLLLIKIQARLAKVRAALKTQRLGRVKSCSIWLSKVQSALKTAAVRIIGGGNFKGSKAKDDSLRTQMNFLYRMCDHYRKLKVTVRRYLKSQSHQTAKKQKDLIYRSTGNEKKDIADTGSREIVHPLVIKQVPLSQNTQILLCGCKGDDFHVSEAEPCLNCRVQPINKVIGSSFVPQTSDTLTLPSNGTGHLFPNTEFSDSSRQMLTFQCLDKNNTNFISKGLRTDGKSKHGDERNRGQQDSIDMKICTGDEARVASKPHEATLCKGTAHNGKTSADKADEYQWMGNTDRSSGEDGSVECSVSLPQNRLPSDVCRNGEGNANTVDLTNIDTANSVSLIQTHHHPYCFTGNSHHSNTAIPVPKRSLQIEQVESNTEMELTNDRNDQLMMSLRDNLSDHWDEAEVSDEELQFQDTDHETLSDVMFQQLPPVNNDGYRIPAALIKGNPASSEPAGTSKMTHECSDVSYSLLKSCPQPDKLKRQAALEHHNVAIQDIDSECIPETHSLQAFTTQDRWKTSSVSKKSGGDVNVSQLSILTGTPASSAKANVSNSKRGLGKASKEKTGRKTMDSGQSGRAKGDLSSVKKGSVLKTASASCLRRRKTENLNFPSLYELLMEKKLSAGVNVLSVHTPLQTEFATLSSAGHVIDRNGREFESLVDWCRSIKNFSTPGREITRSDCHRRVSFQGRILSSFLEPRQVLPAQDGASPETEGYADFQPADQNVFSERNGVDAAALNLSNMQLLMIGDNELIPNDSQWPGQWNDFDKWSP